MPRIGFTGTRKGMTPMQLTQFRHFVERFYRVMGEEEYEWHDGDCIGSDDEAHKMVAAIHRENANAGLPWVKMVGHPGNMPSFSASNVFDESWPVAENLTRNHDIVNSVEIMIACPGEMQEVLRSGTWATIRYARKLKKEGAKLVLIVIYPNGNWEKV